MTQRPPAAAPAAIQRWTALSSVFTGGFGLFVVALAFVPVVMGARTVQDLTTLLILVLMAVMWNALAGYGGLVSVGLQAYIGLGAYATVWFALQGVNPYWSMVLATLFCAVVAVPLSFIVLRFRGAQFAIGTWVVAEAIGIYVGFQSNLGAGTGTSLIQLDSYHTTEREHITYWLTLGLAAFFTLFVFLLLRSRIGASLQAIRDDEEAAASVGVRVTQGKRLLFLLASAGCGAAGAMTVANIFFIEPTSIFSVNYSAFMIFMVLVGGIGTFEGPIIGAIILYFMQQQFGNDGTWYLIGLGATAIVFALLFPRGLWGMLEEKTGLRFMPVGYRVRRGGAP
ncbi:MAG TPA: branched-chain amino acid ABC transporter permease [Solirubrobacteraceae bacterium]|nr:branched-chain amino acid ABC transporter permease [Solirubrobacteraceae bacterium]